MNDARTLGMVLLFACRYLASRPLRADPERLLLAVQMWSAVSEPVNEREFEYCGEMAAREAAEPMTPADIGQLIEPGDLE